MPHAIFRINPSQTEISVNLETLLPPIAAATIFNVFAFAGAWRAGQVEKRTGAAPWYLSLGIVLYGAPLLAFLYFSKSRPLASGLEIFAAAVVAQAMGAGISFVLIKAFAGNRDQTWRERAPMILASAFLLFLVVAGSLKS